MVAKLDSQTLPLPYLEGNSCLSYISISCSHNQFQAFGFRRNWYQAFHQKHWKEPGRINACALHMHVVRFILRSMTYDSLSTVFPYMNLPVASALNLIDLWSQCDKSLVYILVHDYDISDTIKCTQNDLTSGNGLVRAKELNTSRTNTGGVVNTFCCSCCDIHEEVCALFAALSKLDHYCI